MAKVKSNLFKLDHNDEIVNTFEQKINIEEVYKNSGNVFRTECKKLREELDINDVIFTTIDINKKNFSEHQFDLLNYNNIAIYTIEGVYHFLNKDGKIFKISDTSLLSIILNTPRPRKISYNLEGNTSSMYSMELLANMLENIKSTTIGELINSYGFEYKSDPYAFYILLHVYGIYEKLIYSHNYNNYINYEQKIYNIMNGTNMNIDESICSSHKKECINKLEKLSNKLNIELLLDLNEIDFLNKISSFSDNPLIYPSLNAKLLNSIALTDYAKLVELAYQYNYLSSPVQPHYDTYFNSCIKLLNHIDFNCTSNMIIRGTYQHLFQNILAELLNHQKYIEIVNSDKNLYEELIKSKGKEYKPNILILLEWALQAFIYGCSSIDEYKVYFFKEKLTALSEEDITNIINLLHSELNDIIEQIDKTSSAIYKDKSILHCEFNNFYKLILNIKRRLEKDLILELNEYIIDFNSKNKAKIHLIGYSDGYIYIQCEEGSLNVAMDTLTRILVKIYDKNLKKTKAFCLVESL